jgi:hypothetical protein
MLSWASILYGAALFAVVAGAALTALARLRQPAVILTGVLATAVGPLGWNAILRATHASQFFTDAPLRLLPASWQDTGSGVFALAATALLVGLGSLATAPARRTIGLAVLCGLAASWSTSTCINRGSSLAPRPLTLHARQPPIPPPAPHLP